MARTPSTLNAASFLVGFSLSFCVALGCSFTITNNCQQTIWPATLAGAGTPQLLATGFRLDPGRSVKIPASAGWSGRMWARTGCQFDEAGAGKCLTGDCGGRLECDGSGALPPATLFEITLGKDGSKDFYDVSLVDGYNLPLVAEPMGAAAGGCNATGCVANLNCGCPRELQVEGEERGATATSSGGVVACKSACEVFGLDQYCCRGEFANPSTCRPSFYSTIFKSACPRAYSYAFDDGTSTFTCSGSDYSITFCPARSGSKRSNDLSTSQGTQGQNGKDENDMDSSANILALHIQYILLLILFFF